MNRPAATAGPSATGATIRHARRARGWSQDFLARRIADHRRVGGECVDQLSIKTQLSRWENGHVEPDRFTRQVLADVFSTAVEALFGVQAADDLPRPVLVSAHVTSHTVELLRARRAVHAQTEATFGPAEASALVSHDLTTIDGLLRVAPAELTMELHEVAAMIAELGGWIAQDSGDIDQALICTTRALSYAQAAGNPGLEAMILMRWANVIGASDPVVSAALSQRSEEPLSISATACCRPMRGPPRCGPGQPSAPSPLWGRWATSCIMQSYEGRLQARSEGQGAHDVDPAQPGHD